MKELVVMYLPTILAFAVTVFNIVKTIRGFKVIDINPPIKRLESNLNEKFNIMNEKFQIQDRYNALMEAKLEAAEKRADEAEAKVQSIESSINAKFAEQTELLTNLVRADVELKAEVRREKDDSKAV